ncbi:hypothetical protein CWI38_0432p0030 [Hamiltosporidium tvaerminnensis]|uniref:Uncharacterized protein n=1 Tax=Hamiltosporidium tvaerminnensis TaxID=1176355 RepID=A0A4Q9LXK0_9MICR|nr:hypothetical protein CWI38_0432p0030 [Hamiltosporidium tvaerminnensis]
MSNIHALEPWNQSTELKKSAKKILLNEEENLADSNSKIPGKKYQWILYKEPKYLGTNTPLIHASNEKDDSDFTILDRGIDNIYTESSN